MKIIIAINDSYAANFIKGQASYLKKNGHDVIIISGPGKEIDSIERNEEAKVIRVSFSREISIIKDISTLIQVFKIWRKEKPDIVNAGNPKTGLLFSLVHLFFWKTPYIFTLRGLRSDTLSGLKKIVVQTMEYVTTLFANKVIVISPSLKEHAVKRKLVSEKKCILLSKGSSNGYDVHYYKKSESLIGEGIKLLKKHNIPADSFKLIYVGRLTRDKGIVELLEAYKSCIKNKMNIQLIIAGPIEKDDPIPQKYYDFIEKEESIHFLGKQLDIRPVYTIGDALVLYSYREGFGNVVLEASCFEIPTIVADIPGLRDTTVNNETGLVIEPKSEEALSEAIDKLYNNRSFSAKLGVNGRTRVENYFKNEVIWNEQLKLYEHMINKKH